MITGRNEVVDGADHLVLRRSIEAPVEEVWAAFTESDRLGLWFATWVGDPASGQVEVTWAFEEDMPTEPYVIDECDPPHHLRVRNVHEDPTQVWTIDVALTEAEPGTALTFSQPLSNREMVRDVGPGWEYYLDRLQESIETGHPSTIAWDGYLDLTGEYVREFDLT